jgi:hypothetical protein
MEIDNPITAAKRAIERDEQQHPSLAVIRAEKFLGIIVPPIAPFSKVLGDLVEKKKQENRDLLLQTTASEVEKLLDREHVFAEDHKRWVQDELPGLLAEGVAKSEQTRGREKVIRLARVIGHAIAIGPLRPADLASEMMRVAVELSDQDIIVLRDMSRVQAEMLGNRSGRPEINDANSAWARLEKESDFFRSGGEIYSVCLKLQSLGLVMAVERLATTLGLQSVPYALLPRGIQFLEYIAGAV